MGARLVLPILLASLAACALPDPYEVARHYCESQGYTPGTMAYWDCEEPAVARERARQAQMLEETDQPSAPAPTFGPLTTYPVMTPPPTPQGPPTDVGTPYIVTAPSRAECVGVVPVPLYVATPCP